VISRQPSSPRSCHAAFQAPAPTSLVGVALIPPGAKNVAFSFLKLLYVNLRMKEILFPRRQDVPVVGNLIATQKKNLLHSMVNVKPQGGASNILHPRGNESPRLQDSLRRGSSTLSLIKRRRTLIPGLVGTKSWHRHVLLLSIDGSHPPQALQAGGPLDLTHACVDRKPSGLQGCRRMECMQLASLLDLTHACVDRHHRLTPQRMDARMPARAREGARRACGRCCGLRLSVLGFANAHP